jgi:hypothetical protein
MPRLTRIEDAGANYHVLSRDDRRKAILLDHLDLGCTDATGGVERGFAGP